MTTTYQGWKNRETWHIALWIDNDRTLYDIWHAAARECLDSESVETATESLAERLETDWTEYLSDGLSDLRLAFMTDAIQDVDWDAIAKHYIQGEIEDARYVEGK